MRYMFTMMNNARLGVGVEGLGAGRAGLPAGRRVRPGAPAGPGAGRARRREVADHRAPRRAPHAAHHAGAHRGHAGAGLPPGRGRSTAPRTQPDEADRTAAHERVELLTPLVKSWCTDRAETVTSIGIQVHGGMGYIEETGVAQYYRDAKITQIYEGTNGIQAMDLVGRKLPMRQGGVIADHVGRDAGHRRRAGRGRRRAGPDPRRARRPPSTRWTPRTRGSSSRASADPSRRSRWPRRTSGCSPPWWLAGSWPAPRWPPRRSATRGRRLPRGEDRDRPLLRAERAARGPRPAPARPRRQGRPHGSRRPDPRAVAFRHGPATRRRAAGSRGPLVRRSRAVLCTVALVVGAVAVPVLVRPGRRGRRGAVDR